MTRSKGPGPHERAASARAQQLVTAKEYAARVRQHVESVRRRARAGRQPGARLVGGEWRIDLSKE